MTSFPNQKKHSSIFDIMKLIIIVYCLIMAVSSFNYVNTYGIAKISFFMSVALIFCYVGLALTIFLRAGKLRLLKIAFLFVATAHLLAIFVDHFEIAQGRIFSSVDGIDSKWDTIVILIFLAILVLVTFREISCMRRHRI